LVVLSAISFDKEMAPPEAKNGGRSRATVPTTGTRDAKKNNCNPSPRVVKYRVKIVRLAPQYNLPQCFTLPRLPTNVQ
jgi:hypothetical protein